MTWKHRLFKFCWNHGWYHTDRGGWHGIYGFALRKFGAQIWP